jgi:hypothetical protein
MRFRKLRIAWSVFWGVACVLLIALWVRSYWWRDLWQTYIPPKAILLLSSEEGQAVAHLEISDSAPGDYGLGLSSYDEPAYRAGWHGREFEFRWYRYPNGVEVFMPHWFIVTLAAALGTIPWIRRFSLRTLLIATTLIAVVLGLAVYAARK